MKELLFSVTEADCSFDYYRGSGKGGQKRNKTSNCVRCVHIKSGAVGKSEEGRSQRRNKEMAFKRMAMSAVFKRWHRIETSKRTGMHAIISKQVSNQMSNIKVEGRNDKGQWTEITND